MKNYRIDYQIKDKDGKPSPECYDLTQDDEFQYALTGIGYTKADCIISSAWILEPSSSRTKQFSNQAVRGFLLNNIVLNTLTEKGGAITINIRKRLLKLVKSKTQAKIRRIANFFL